jgi:HAD superfamily hydrolase (TIGR01459 family)
MSSLRFAAGLAEIAVDYDALVCDVWGVIHDGSRSFPEACEALRQFRKLRGPVALLSNAPRPKSDILKQFERFGIPNDCYDEIITSGAAARLYLERRAVGQAVRMFHLGPERDRGVFEGLNVVCVPQAEAELVLCTGLFDDDAETPASYATVLSDMARMKLRMLCANPDIVVQRGGKLVYCAGALAQAYEKAAGEVVYFGKPHPPIYGTTLAALGSPSRPLAIGDGMNTDIKGANSVGLDALFITDGIHRALIEPYTVAHMEQLFRDFGVSANATMRALVW